MDTVEPQEIRNQKMIVVEGKDDIGFFTELLDHLRIGGVYVDDIEGTGNFADKLPSIEKRSGFLELTHFAVVRDRDEDNAFESIVNIMRRKMSFSEIPDRPCQFASGDPRVGIFIMPGGSVDGNMIEDLCLKTVETHPVMKCVNDFAECVLGLKQPPSNIAKTKVQAFLASQWEEANSLGRGAQKGYWDFESSALNELKGFLEHLR